MRKAAILFNPASGNQKRNLELVNTAADVLRSCGISVRLVPTFAAGTAPEQTDEAIANGCDTVFAAGGDGTMFEVLQSLAARHTPIPMGLIPLGTGNVLAEALHLPRDPVEAVRKQVHYLPRRIDCGRVECADEKTGSNIVRYFTLMCGIGMDAEMLHRTQGMAKRMLGENAYHWSALQLMSRFRLPQFLAQLPSAATDREVFGGPRIKVSQACACRVANFRKAGRIAPGASLLRDDFQLVLYKTASPLSYFREAMFTVFGAEHGSADVERRHGREMACLSLAQEDLKDNLGSIIRVEADGEVLGTLPARISIQPYAFSLLMPEN